MIGPFKITWLVLGLAAPLVFGAAVTWLSYFLGTPSRSGKPAHNRAGTVLVIGTALASAVGMLALLGMPPWRPLEGTHWLLMAVLPTAMVVALLAIPDRSDTAALGWVLRILIAVGVAPLMTRPLVPYTWTQTQAFGWWMGIGVFGCLGWWLTRRFAVRHGGRLAVFVLGGTCAALAGITMASGYLSGGQLAASPALALAGAWLVMLPLGSQQRRSAALADLAYPLLLGMLVYNWQFGWRMQHDAAPYVVAGLLAVAPLGIWAAAIPVLSTRSEPIRVAVAVLVCVLPLASASGLAGYEAMLRAQAASEYEYGY